MPPGRPVRPEEHVPSQYEREPGSDPPHLETGLAAESGPLATCLPWIVAATINPVMNGLHVMWACSKRVDYLDAAGGLRLV